MQKAPIEVLLGMIVSEAIQVANARGGHVSRSLIQKVVCYLQPRGIRLGYDFTMTPSGPASGELLLQLDQLEVARIIENRSLKPEQYADYAPSVEAFWLLSQYKPALDHVRPRVQAVLDALAPFTSEHLMLIANLHFFYLTLKMMPPALQALRERVCHAVAEVESSFSRETIEAVYDALRGIGCIEDATSEDELSVPKTMLDSPLPSGV